MKRLAIICCTVMLLSIVAVLSQPAMDPDNFTGQWYSAQDQTVYLFQEGIIHCLKYPIAISQNDSISGAYSCSKNTILLFATGIDGLETERELHLVFKGDGSFLCENSDGSGRVYFIRYHK